MTRHHSDSRAPRVLCASHWPPSRAGFTLIELLVVITIILIVSAVALPTVLPALSHRQVSEAARLLQAALVGARDSAIKNNAPSGIRLLPDPVLNGVNPSTGLIDGSQALAANRIIPIGAAPDYTEGLVSIYSHDYSAIQIVNGYGGSAAPNNLPCLVLEESVLGSSGLPNAPTSWFWNVRVGDQIQINNAGPWYTVVGPMTLTPANGNNELFVNVGAPGTSTYANITTLLPTEFLLLVNGQDDNGNGWVDEGWDGVNNNLSYEIANTLTPPLTDEYLPLQATPQSEWETETWHGAIQSVLSSAGSLTNQPYTIHRRPAPSNNAREVLLPTNVVIDMTTFAYPSQGGASLERSRLPVNPYTGYVDVMVYPNGTVVPVLIYSSPSAVGLSSSFLHFWLAERSDVFAPQANSTDGTNGTTWPPFLPLPQGVAPHAFNGAEIKGEYRLVTLFTRTGLITTNDAVPFDPGAQSTPSTIGTANFNTSYPFLQAQQGVRGGQ